MTSANDQRERCRTCGVPLDGRRFRDAKGQAFCPPCAEHLRQMAGIVPARTAAALKSSSADSSFGLALPKSFSEGTSGDQTAAPNDDLIPLLDDEPSLAHQTLRGELHLCPSCGIALAPGALSCRHCGQGAVPGVRPIEAPSETGRKCRKCGYNISGLPGSRCPECGTTNRADRRTATEREIERREARWTYQKPLILLAIGVIVASTLMAIEHGPLGFPAYLIGLAMLVPTGFAAYWLMGLFWFGFDAPFHLILLRLTAIYAFTDGCIGLSALTGIQFLPWVVGLFVYIGYMMDLLEIELAEAVAVGALTIVIRPAIAFCVFAYLF